MSSSREGMILSNILNFFPKRGIWRMRQEGTCSYETMKQTQSMNRDVLSDRAIYWTIRAKRKRPRESTYERQSIR